VRVAEQSEPEAAATAMGSFTVTARRTGFGSDYQRYISNCLRQTLDKLRVRPSEIFPPDAGSPDDPRVRLIDEKRLGEVIRDVARKQPDVANQLRELGRELGSRSMT
jgi:hypothetical protein